MKISSYEMWKPVAIKNKTVRTLLNGKVVPTWLAIVRAARKI